jgi:hypothetical protein
MVRLLLILACLAILAQPAGAAARIRTTAPLRITETTARLHFLYSYPAEAAAIPELGALLRKEGLDRLAESRPLADDKRLRPRAGPDAFEQVWEVSADTGDLLALTAAASAYQDGAAHGHFAYRTLIWSRSARRALGVAELFTDGEKGVASLLAGFCPTLAAARADRWRPDWCPEAAAAIVPFAARGDKIRSFRMMVSGDDTPAGYAGGAHEIVAPVTPSILTLIRPALRRSFEVSPGSDRQPQ